MKYASQNLRQCQWHNEVADAVLKHGGTNEDALFLVSLARNVDARKLPENTRRAAAQLWRAQRSR